MSDYKTLLQETLEKHKNKYIKRCEKLLAEDVELNPEDLYMAELEQRAMDCEAMEMHQKEFIKYLEEEEDRLARECSNIYEDDLGKTRLVNEDIFNEVNNILKKYKKIIGDDKVENKI